jgi:CheY-like chemotaxis protein
MSLTLSIQEPPGRTGVLAPSRPTILVVDDDPLLLDLAEELLTEEHYRVLRATSGPQALQIVVEEHPQLFLLDYMLPGMSGLELFDLLHARPGYETIPAIMVSAALPAHDDLARRAVIGIQKPYEIDALLAQVVALISTAHHAVA